MLPDEISVPRGIDDILQRLYDYEINIRLEWGWNGGVVWSLVQTTRGPRWIDDQIANCGIQILPLSTRTRPAPHGDPSCPGGIRE